MKISLALILVLLAASSAAQQRPELPRPAGVPSNAEIRTKLESSQPADQAWGAWWAAQLNVTELAPAIERVATANASAEWPGPAVTSVALDALVQLNTKSSASFGVSMHAKWPVQALILLSRGGPDADPVLVDLVRQERGYCWLASVNLAVSRRSAGIGAALLGALEIPVWITLTSTGGESFGGGLGAGGSVADGGVGLMVGFPPVSHYTFSGGGRPGDVLLASGPRTVYYVRTPGAAGETEPAFWPDESDSQRPADILAALRGLLRTTGELSIRTPETSAVRWVDQARLDRDVDAIRQDITDRYRRLLDWLKSERLLSAAETTTLAPPAIRVWIDDRREGASLPPVTRMSDAVTTTLTIPASADLLAGNTEDVWIANRGRVEKWQQDRPAPVAVVEMPRPCGKAALTYEAVWVPNCSDQSLYRIDRKTNTIAAKIPTGLADPDGQLNVAVSPNVIWLLTDAAGVLSRIDPETNTVVAKIRVAPYSFAVAFEPNTDSIWVTNTGAPGARGAGSVQRIDPRTNTVVATIAVGPRPRFLIAEDRAIWTLNEGDGTVSRIDPNANQVVATIDAGVPGAGGDIVANGLVWVRGRKTLLQAISPSSNRIVQIFGPPAGAGSVCSARGGLWVSAPDVQKVWVIGVR